LYDIGVVNRPIRTSRSKSEKNHGTKSSNSGRIDGTNIFNHIAIDTFHAVHISLRFLPLFCANTVF